MLRIMLKNLKNNFKKKTTENILSKLKKIIGKSKLGED